MDSTSPDWEKILNDRRLQSATLHGIPEQFFQYLKELEDVYKIDPTKLKYQGGTLCVEIDGYWYGVIGDNNVIREIASSAMNFARFRQLAKDREDLLGQIVLVLSNGKIFVAETDGDALQLRSELKDDFAYVGMLGESRNFSSILLHDDSIPEDF